MSKLQERNVANERVYTVEEIAREARISRTAAYELVKKGLFPAIRVGSSIRIPKKPFDAIAASAAGKSGAGGCPEGPSEY